MALIETYDGLVSSVIAAYEDDGTEFQNYIPTAIDLAETRLIKEVFKDGVAQDFDVPVNQGVNKIPKPVGYRASRSVYSINGTTITRLIKRPRSFLAEYWPDSSVQGTPKYYCDFSGDEFIVAPTPDALTTFRMHYIGRPSKLSPTNQTNFFVEFCADVLFYATMVEMCRFDKDAAAKAEWENAYQTGIASLANEAKRERGDDDQQQTITDDSVNQ